MTDARERLEKIIRLHECERKFFNRNGETKYPFLISDNVERMLGSDAVRRQFIPSELELDEESGDKDALAEDSHRIMPRLVRRYGSRAALLASDRCFANCRHCFRKNWMARQREESRANSHENNGISDGELDTAARWLEGQNGIREILITGGDPLVLPNERLEMIIRRLREAKSDLILRLGSRSMLTNPKRIDHGLQSILRKSNSQAPLFFMTHFNHADELQGETLDAIRIVSESGVAMFNQTVILKGVNDTVEAMEKLCIRLLANRIKPYYAFLCDRVAGTSHFWTSPADALRIEALLRLRLSGLEMPTFAADLPGGGGKVPLVNNYVKSEDRGRMLLRTADGKGVREYAIETAR